MVNESACSGLPEASLPNSTLLHFYVACLLNHFFPLTFPPTVPFFVFPALEILLNTPLNNIFSLLFIFISSPIWVSSVTLGLLSPVRFCNYAYLTPSYLSCPWSFLLLLPTVCNTLSSSVNISSPLVPAIPLLSLVSRQDEPSSGMDPRTKRHLWKIISEEVKGKCAVVLTSHRWEYPPPFFSLSLVHILGGGEEMQTLLLEMEN